MLTFLVLLYESPPTRAIQEHLASLPCRDEANPTIIQIMRQERNYFRQLKVWNMRLTSYIPALGMLTSPLVLLSKPVGPIMSWVSWAYRKRIMPWAKSKGLNAFSFFIKELSLHKLLRLPSVWTLSKCGRSLEYSRVGLLAVQGTCLYP